MRRLFLSLLVFVFALPAISQAKHPFTFEDMMKLKRVGEPVVSPDGKWVVFSVVDVDLEANTKTPHIWIVPTRGERARDHRPTRTPTVRAGRRTGSGLRFCRRRRRLAGVDCGFRWRRGICHRRESADFDRDGSRGRALVARWERNSFHFRCVSRVRSVTARANLQRREVRRGCEIESEGANLHRLLYRHWNAYKEGKRTHIFVVNATSKFDRHRETQGDYSRAPPRSHARRLRCARLLPWRAGQLCFLA